MKRLTALACVAATALGMTACTPEPVMNTPEQVGGATPASSPQQQGAKPDGEIIELDDAEKITDLDTVGGVLAVRTGASLRIGTPEQFGGASDEAFTTDIAGCGEVTTSGAQDGGTPEFLVACGNTVRVFPAADAQAEQTADTQGFAATSAVRAPDGSLLLASDKEAMMKVIPADGGEAEDIEVAAPTDQLVIVGESPVRMNRGDSTIQNIDWQEDREGGRLRIGVGVGTIASGPSEVIVAADALGRQLAVYTSGTVVRLHQLGPIDGTPWAAGWDGKLAWVTSTDTNQAFGFDISTGAPVEKKKLNVVPDAQSMAAAEEFTAFGSATSPQLQIVRK